MQNEPSELIVPSATGFGPPKVVLPDGIKRIPHPDRVEPGGPTYLARMVPPQDDASTRAASAWVEAHAAELAAQAGVALPQPDADLAMLPPPPPPAPASAPEPSAQNLRLVLSYGPQPGLVVVSLERLPDWDVAEGDTWVVPTQHLRSFLAIMRRIVKVKDLTGGGWQSRYVVEESA